MDKWQFIAVMGALGSIGAELMFVSECIERAMRGKRRPSPVIRITAVVGGLVMAVVTAIGVWGAVHGWK